MAGEDSPGAQGALQPATEQEIRDALKRLDDDVLARLAVAAGAILARHPRLTLDIAREDLISLSVQALLEGRRTWYPKRIDFLGLLIGVMRSLASNATRIGAKTEIQTISYEQLAQSSGEDDRQFLETAASESLTPEELLVESERQAHEEVTLAIVRARLAGDAAASAILDLLLKDFSKREIRAELGMSDKDFWTADRRLTRIIEDAAKTESPDK